MSVAAIALALSGRWLLPLLGSSYSAEKLALTGTLFLGLLFWLPMSACIATWRAVLNARGKFAVAAIAPLAMPLATIVLLYAGASRWGVYVLTAGMLVGVASECVVLAWNLRRLGYRLLPAWNGWTSDLAAIRNQYLPFTAGAILGSACLVVDQAFAGRLGTGSVSGLAFGTKIATVLLAICAAGAATAVLPEFSRLVAAQRWEALRRVVRVDFTLVMLITIPATAVLVAITEPAVRIFFERGAFDAAAVQLVARVQRWSLLQIPFAILLALAGRMATAISATSLLAKVGVAALAVTALADWWLSRSMGVAGIALSNAIVQATSVVLLLILLYRREPRLFSSSKAGA
jgi:putative peptidoglycan lipid II flippase